MTNHHEEAGDESPEFRVAFGIGCWNFGLKREGRFSLSIKDYRTLLTKELETIPSLNKLEIDVEEDDAIELNKGHLQITDSGLAIFPEFPYFSIRFELYIPFRIQREIVGPLFNSTLSTERFRIHNLFKYYGPVSVVELIDGKHTVCPSTAVQVVREYLKEQINRMSSSLVFESIGPSPFHVNFWLEGKKVLPQSEHQFECKQLNIPGYASITFFCCIDNFYSKKVACEELFDNLADELDLFYEIARSDRESLEMWDKIEAAASRLCEYLQSTSQLERLRTSIGRGRELSKLHILLSSFESEYIRMTHFTDTQCRKLQTDDKPNFLRNFVEDSLTDRPVFAVKQMKDLVSFIEARRSKAVELMIVLVAAVVGGLAGWRVGGLAGWRVGGFDHNLAN